MYLTKSVGKWEFFPGIFQRIFAGMFQEQFYTLGKVSPRNKPRNNCSLQSPVKNTFVPRNVPGTIPGIPKSFGMFEIFFYSLSKRINQCVARTSDKTEC